MVRRSALVYELLKTDRSIDGLSKKEILLQISQIHNIFAGKVLEKEISVALKRGIDFGIIKKHFNKYRYQTEFFINDDSKNQTLKWTRSTRKRKRGRTRTSKRRRPLANKKRQTRKRKVTEPKPRLPTLPPWTPEKRDLRKETIPRVVKHH
ncbi:hypothetical protein V1477_007195 [Vespula maculifrons]|uniref:Uncharacterized protein n=1 Tax=Vespula maculifrons TaxID=7453 RepID=A0ABD2CHU3_VESMC